MTRILRFFWANGDLTLEGNGILLLLAIPAAMLIQLLMGG